MKNENRKKSNSRPTLLVYASCNAVLLLITLFIAYFLFISVVGMVLMGISERNGFNLGLFLPVFVFFIASLFAVKGYFERIRNQLARYSKIGEERKRIERLTKHTEAETPTETDTLDYHAETENTNKEKYS